MKSSDRFKKIVCLSFLVLISICCVCLFIWCPAMHMEIPKKDEIEVNVGSTQTTPVPPKYRALPNNSIEHPGTILSFLAGDYCLQGSDNSFRFEFCYGKSARQYPKASGATIRLGEFDLKVHEQWVKDHPYKFLQPSEKGTYVSYFCSKGDICDRTRKPREVEVKLKCVNSAGRTSLIEPFICRYVLQVESFMFCELLPYADEFGIFHDVPDDLLFLKIKPN